MAYADTMAVVDTDHIHEHMLAELGADVPLVTPGSYGVAFDTTGDEMQKGLLPARHWSTATSPKTAVVSWPWQQRRIEAK